MKVKFIYFILFIMYFAESQSQDQPRYYWQYYTVSLENSIGSSTNLIFDKLGNPNVAFRDANNKIKFAKFNEPVWDVQIVDSTLLMGNGQVTMTLDPLNYPHIFYHVTDGANLKHTHFDGDGWNSQIVDTRLRTNSNYWISSKTDSLGVIHFCYEVLYSGENQLTYNYYDGVDYGEPEPVDDTGFTGKWNSMSIDEQGRPSIAYFEDNGADLKFAFRDQQTWMLETIEENTFAINQGYYPSMQLGPGNEFYIAFQDHTVQDSKIKMAIGNYQNWTIEDVVAIDGWETFSTPSSLALDSLGNPHIVYYDTQNNDLIMVYYFQNVWHYETIDSTGSVGQYASLAFDSTGLPAVAYFDATNGVVKYACSRLSPPLDSDEDGILDYIENYFGTDPTDIDSDDDGISDGEEDANQDGFVGNNETNPRLFDSDFDSLSDGLETGKAFGIEAPPGLKGTDLNIFTPDMDPTTTTNPLSNDSDQDGLLDGEEDLNKNGRIENGESDPLKPDSDGDGILDDLEIKLGSNPLDLDSDDDGISDNTEDSNNNGEVDAFETSPSKFDSDDDGDSDGVELGITSGIEDPDGEGPLSGTNSLLFQSDEDPNQNSNPLIWDSDNDKLSDGEEDINHNGKVDDTETNFLIPDSDDDGFFDGDEISFSSDPLSGLSTPSIDTLANHNFNFTGMIPPEWIIVDEGNIDSPSYWSILENSIVQSTNIHGGDISSGGEDPYRPGTYIWLSNFNGNKYKISFRMLSRNYGELGIMFNYMDSENYYRFSMNAEKNYRRLTKIKDGQNTVIELQTFTYELYVWYDLYIYIIDGRIQVYFQNKRIMDISDTSVQSGSIAFYSWKNPVAMFDDLIIVGDTVLTYIDQEITNLISSLKLESVDNKNVLSWEINNISGVNKIMLFSHHKNNDKLLKTYINKDSKSSISKYFFIDQTPWQSEYYKLVLYSENGMVLQEKIVKNIDQNNMNVRVSEFYPSPTSNSSTVAYYAPLFDKVIIDVYDILGRKVRSLKGRIDSNSWNQVHWDGKNELGHMVSKGIYITDIKFFSLKSPTRLKRIQKKVIKID